MFVSPRRVARPVSSGWNFRPDGAAVNKLISKSESNRPDDPRIVSDHHESSDRYYPMIRILWRTLRRCVGNVHERETRAVVHSNRKSSFPERHARSFPLPSASRFFIRSFFVSLLRLLTYLALTLARLARALLR